MKTKRCSKCGVTKSIDDFFWKNKAKGIKQSWCKCCATAARIDYYKRNKDKEKAYDKRRQQGIRRKIFQYLKQHPCIECGENDPVVLDFHHLGDKEKEISNLTNRCWSRVLKEIEKCNVLCANCHRKKTAKEQGWYKYMAS